MRGEEAATTPRRSDLVHELASVLVRYDAASDASMEDWALAEAVWAVMRIHDTHFARAERQGKPRPNGSIHV